MAVKMGPGAWRPSRWLAWRHQRTVGHGWRRDGSVAGHQHGHRSKIEQKGLFHARSRRRLESHLGHLRRGRGGAAGQQQIGQHFPLLSGGGTRRFHRRRQSGARRRIRGASVGSDLTKRRRVQTA